MSGDEFPDDWPEDDWTPDTESPADLPAEQPVTPAPQIADIGPLMGFFAELTDKLRAPAPQPEPEREKKEKAPQLQFANSIDWFENWCRHVYRRKLQSRGKSPAWRADWWNDNEARTRIDSMWRAWEKLRMDPSTGMSVWLKDHGDYHMGVLMGESGPFMDEDSPATAIGDPLPHERPNEALMPDERGELAE